MFEETHNIDGTDVTVGVTENHQTPYLSLSFPALPPEFREGPTIMFYGDDATWLLEALTYVPLLGAAHRLGQEHGEAAASWYNVGGETNAALILQGIEDGDVTVMDSLPSADFSGQCADGYSEKQLCEDVGAPEDNDGDLVPLSDRLVQAYEEAFDAAAQAAVAKLCADMLKP